MRVLHVIPTVARRYGGPSVAIRGMTEALASLGADVTVVTTDADGPGKLDVPLGEAVADGGVTYRYFPRTVPGEWKLSFQMGRWLAREASAFDVVHVHSLFAHPTIVACRAAAAASVPYIIRPLGMLGEWSLQQGAWKKRPYLALVDNRYLSRASAIHATSREEADAVSARGHGERVRIIELGVAAPPREFSRSSSSDGPLKLLFLSRLHLKKGIPLLLDAVADAVGNGANLHLSIAGDGEPQYVSELHERVSARKLNERVRFLGHVSGDAKWRAFAEADAFVLPSSHENFGIAVAEAMMAGLPVVISDQVGIAPEIREAGAGLVVPLDNSWLASALSDLASDRNRAATMGARGRALAISRYSWRSTAERLHELYTELAPQPELSDYSARDLSHAQ